MGAPLAWAGLSSTVMVVAVSFRKASVPSYSSMVGAAEREKVFLPPKYHLLYPTKLVRTLLLPEMLVVTLSVVAGPKPLEVEARMESW